MLNKIIEFSVKNKLIVGLFVIALIVYGSYQTTKLPIDAVPDITNNQVQVITVAPSYGATDIERLVTFPIEQANSNISGLKEFRSFSRFGLSLVTIVFNDNVDVYWARQQVSERLQKIRSQIPTSIGVPELGPITTGLGEIYQYVLRPEKGYEDKYNETELRTIQDWVVRRQLLGVKGVAEVSSFGGKLKQFEIAVDPNKLHASKITINEVFSALEKNNQNTGGAYIEKNGTVLFIRSEGLIGNNDDISSIYIKSTESGAPVFIRDVAEVKTGYATRYGALTYNDEGEVAGAVVMMLKGANSNDVIKNVKERINQIKKTLPEGVVLEPFLDRSKMVNNAIGTVEKNLIEGALIVIFILVLFLGNFRAGLLVASVIPLAMLFAIILMNAFGVSGNLMSLGALDFGLIVDGAVIIVEAVMHQLSHSRKFTQLNRLTQNEMDTEVEFSASKMMNSAVFGQIIILIVYLPIFTLEGIEGKMFIPMAQTVAFALLGAFILSLTYIPMMSAWVLSKNVKHKANISDRLMMIVEKGYQNMLIKVLHRSKSLLISVVVLFVTALFILSRIGGEFIPALEEGDFAVETRVLTGSNLSTTIEKTQQAAKILKERFPEVEKVVAKIGSGEVPTDPMPMEAADLMIILKNKSEWTSAETFDELAEKMTLALEDVPGITTGFQYPVQMRFNELMTGAKQDVVCKIFGEDLDTLAFYAEKLSRIVNGVEGAKEIYVEPVTGIPQIIINYKREIIAQYNLNIEDVNKVVNLAFAGQSAGLVFEGEKRFDLVVRLNSGRRKNLEDVQDLLIPTPFGNQIPLSQLANVEIKSGPNQIQREDAKRRIVIGFNIGGRDVQSIVNELQKKVEAQIKFPTGYYVNYGGSFENLNAAKDRLMVAVPVSLVLIFILLFFAFNSVRQGLLIYTAIPLSAIGGILFLAVRGMPFSISAGIGFIALFGVAVLNGIVLISEFNRLKHNGMTSLHRIVILGTRLRLRPVLMTAFVASLGFLPMALSNGAGAEVQRPLATVVIGGLIIATFLTLFVLPVLYILFEKTSKMKNKQKPVVGFILAFLFVNIGLQAQSPITLQAAIDSALKNNLSVKNEGLKAEYQKKMIGSSNNISQTNVFIESGKINSAYTDNRFGVSQSFNFPTVYSNQKSVLKEEWKMAVLNVSLKETEIRKMTTQVFYSLLFLKEKEKLLQRADSNYNDFLSMAERRYNLGESNVLEKITAETQRSNILLQIRAMEEEIVIANLQFQILINAKQKYEPTLTDLKLALTSFPDSSAIKSHPSLKILEQQKIVAIAGIKLEKSRFLPDINFGYYSMTMKGTGADNISYTGSTRFSSAQVGIGIPLFFGAQKSKLSASKTNRIISENNYQQQQQQLVSELQSALTQYKNITETVVYFEKTGLKNADTIQEIANLQFKKGEINYLEWVVLTNQSIGLRNNYLDAVKALNETIIAINYLSSNTN
ncbi:CusA/CzcA family heavy metal efflux RND transporter [Aurantibacillus circumpalustris]|uniref:CusA/CzcA family heavy metal efflux RND transporter n=1 Tax=Aurantibacillus circumpalustris TaxID=3036359 RepID=UPI00295BDE9E|nr:CusA/CzcA family heavy metal efflux RND transporter [Aurantibacillus circumpalustris]